MRLDYFIAHATGLTRSQAKRLIASGSVTVSGVAKPTARLQLAGESVCLDGAPLTLPGHRYLMLHKPPGVVCATEDPGHRTVLDLLPGELRRDMHSAGRLDIDTTGLVLLTTDGQWSHRITTPNTHCPKRYRVTTAAPLTPDALQQLRDGVLLHDSRTPTRPAQAEQLGDTELLLTISEGRYHQVKRMLAATGNRVTALHREAIGNLTLDSSLAPGTWRALDAAEIALFA
ncbi:pseudouridine synthase [Alcanivorax sp. JB21]|uniref:pseudouridine synthase n=1 Tax=Alcanivorax limicola TaxID=2874102 RepID=UPI001CC0B27C|nr:pseudouridine synthase [Alcanivorax limicola]MBZ2190280.1 pseudouridine synthase [Alcanivorax limicola]